MKPEVELKTLPLSAPFRIAHGASSSRQVVRLCGGGAVGEAPFVPYYHEDIDATLAWLEAGQGACAVSGSGVGFGSLAAGFRGAACGIAAVC